MMVLGSRRGGGPPPAPEPSPVSVWIAPSVPGALRDLTQQTLEAAPERFYGVPVSNQAQVRVESRPELPLTHWVYAAVAPFPTREDSCSMEQLRALWEGSEQQPPVLLSPATAEALRPQLGEPAGAALRSTADSELLDAAWALKEARALVPFEQLEPRWKVLQVEGQNPLHLHFESL